jgi:polysaccharide export outer membrane protein
MQKKYLKNSHKLCHFTSVAILFLLLLNACIPQKQTVYFQDLSQKNDYQNPYAKIDTITNKYKLKVNDLLYIYVYTSNPKLSEFFNSGRNNTNITGQNTFLYSYIIDDDMNIDFPFVGKINLSGCTSADAKDRILEALNSFLNDAQITLKLLNPSFVALGEFGKVGRIEMGNEQINIFEAVALAGDIKVTGKKKKVKITRPTDEGSITYLVDLTDKNILDSDIYYIYNNDIIYVRPMKAKSWGIGETFSFGVLGTVLAFTISIIALTRK